jgi:hypothetical protein
MNCEIAEFIPSVKTRLLRLWLAMTSEGPLAKTRFRTFYEFIIIYSSKEKSIRRRMDFVSSFSKEVRANAATSSSPCPVRTCPER